MSAMIFKTIEECSVELVANTTINGEDASFLPISAARCSFGKEDNTGKDKGSDLKLMRYLADHKHLSCFEHNYATFLIECPLFVRSQIMKHKFSFNEISRRYTSENLTFWIPDSYRKQSKNNKQASVDGESSLPSHEEKWKDVCAGAFSYYEKMLKDGVCREQARGLLPQSLLTKFYMTGNVRGWWSFFNARCSGEAQYETRVIASKLKGKMLDLWPIPVSLLMEYK